ncbi:hypothetical protein F6Q07_01680 [Pectobacterium parmentieri]|uniref:hypothetical protein n=1 Tax=Pectobacterium parmentieri TaxID=1905730 RepID=UPI000EAFCDB6|nr:hypothetical protein [Pectobacterium parmentieri]AYH01800.1 hypothetical protein C5E26_13105 [Pectobacterium parmentieri]AYH28067.1 hypothetical protein C5E20_13510 [Pectobacterium parmentieri]AYH32372.1 hypothetical protein C5E19_12535 [Pectobacterium parmentieri]MBI0470485.1 hypothetical protein [Pectobacterium parmentieri]MBI0493085.1 hypothetical protein [Pectobacterium parmentieri]
MVIQKVRANDRFIEELLNGWISANQRYVELLNRTDCCWWYNERTNVSVLAGAAWSLGWAAIEEYPSGKKRKGDTEENLDNNTSKGRVDLYIKSELESIALEAKHVWHKLDKDINKDICYIDYARSDAECLIKQAGRHFAATFVVFYTKENLNAFILEESISATINHTIKKISNDAISYAYLIDNKSAFMNHENKYYQSVALILEQIEIK